MTQPQAYAEQDERHRLREELKLSEARRASLMLILNQYREEEVELEVDIALASQPRPKILDVLDAALKVKAEYDAVPFSARRYVGKNEDELFAAVAATEKE